MRRRQREHAAEVFDGFVFFAEALVGDAASEEGVQKFWVHIERLVVVLDGPRQFTVLLVDRSAAEVAGDITRIKPDGGGAVHNGQIKQAERFVSTGTANVDERFVWRHLGEKL